MGRKGGGGFTLLPCIILGGDCTEPVTEQENWQEINNLSKYHVAGRRDSEAALYGMEHSAPSEDALGQVVAPRRRRSSGGLSQALLSDRHLCVCNSSISTLEGMVETTWVRWRREEKVGSWRGISLLSVPSRSKDRHWFGLQRENRTRTLPFPAPALAREGHVLVFSVVPELP